MAKSEYRIVEDRKEVKHGEFRHPTVSGVRAFTVHIDRLKHYEGTCLSVGPVKKQIRLKRQQGDELRRKRDR